MGFNGKISEDMEEYLLSREDRLLDLSDIPDDDLVEEMNGVHLGDEMHFTVTKRVATGGDSLLNRAEQLMARRYVF